MKNTQLDTALFEQVLATLECGLIVCDSQQEVVWSNAYLQALAKSASVDQANRQAFLQSLVKEPEKFNINTHPNKVRCIEHQHQDLTVAGTCYQVHSFFDRSKEAELSAHLSQMRDLALSSQFKDPMTGLLNADAFQLVLEPQVARCRRYHNPICAIALQLQYEDDPANLDRHVDHIRTACQQLRELSRWADQIHYDTQGIFTLVLPETQADDAGVLIDKIEAKLMSYPWLAGVHFGLTQWLKSDTLTSFLKRASLALESSLHQGVKSSTL